MDKKKGTFLIIIAALLVAGSIGIGLSMGDMGALLAIIDVDVEGEVWGGDGSKAVYGHAKNTADVRNYGGYFVADGGRGRGVCGRATNTGDDINYGGFFYAAGEQGRGVFGQSNGSSGYGVKGWASNTGDVKNYGGHFSASGSKGIGVYGAGRAYNFYAAGSGAHYGPFTGAHEVKLSDDFPENVTPGMIVSVTGETQVRDIDEKDISFSSTLPTVQLSDMTNDSKVLGVLISELSLLEEHWYAELNGKDRFGCVNALGEGRVLVTNINGDIEAGDYITTSVVAGYGQKQDDDLLHSYTLGKAIESVNWSKDTTTVGSNGITYKAYPIAVVYTSG
jgi:hypothetical protein